MKRRSRILKALILINIVLVHACQSESITQLDTPTPIEIDKNSLIPVNAVKMNPETDENPPIIYSYEYEKPIPIPGYVNTAGAEDGVFVTPDGNTMYFFFTPNMSIPIEKQIYDGVTGLYVSTKENGEWGKPNRILLQEPGKVAADGCTFVQGNTMWFCSAREGFEGMHWFTAEDINGKWKNWKNSDFDPNYQVGELYISNDGMKLYFGSAKTGAKGGLDIWVSEKSDNIWQEPINITNVNTSDDEGWPALNPTEDELWLTRNWGVWRSKFENGEWQPSELIVSPLAGEASIDNEGNLYFVHHYLVNGTIIEADIYVAYRKK